MNYCSSCGEKLVAGAQFCIKCGAKVGNETQQPIQNNLVNQNNNGMTPTNYEKFAANYNNGAQYYTNVSEVWIKAATYEKISSTLWLIVAVLQVIMAITGVLGFKILMIGIWNVYAAISGYLFSSEVRAGNKDVPEAYRKNLWQIITMLILNIVIGGVIGVISACMDLYTRHYILEHENYFSTEDETEVA